MQFHASQADLLTQKTDCALVAVFEKGKLSSAAQALDEATGGVIRNLVKKGDFKGETGESLVLHAPTGCAADRVVLLGFGPQGECKPGDFRRAMDSAAKAVKQTGSKQLHLFCDDVAVADRDEDWKAQQAGLVIAQRLYQVQALKSKKTTPPSLGSVTYCVSDKDALAGIKKAAKSTAAMAEGIGYARELGNLPGNVCTPSYLASEAKKLAKGSDTFSAKVLGEKQMRELGMGSLLSVSAGSEQEAQLIVMEYKGGAKNAKPVVLVGKGITFDSGGISLKPGAGMDEMKYDMCGAASVFGTMKAIEQLQPKINVVAIVPAAENMPSGSATKPGDIVTSMAGKTIEVLNTDAEGRLILCDALTYAERFKPEAVIDIATLTGACVIALGNHASGLYSNRDELAEALLAAGDYTGDRAWRMPLWDEYKKQLDSNFADLANIGGKEAGSVTAACFLSHFTESYPWAHLDVAGTAWLSGAEKGATGRPVALLLNYLLSR
ncbi:leucyl aminopeptidase [Gilvimarinus sp. F26214L]|uniref:leucyl aminopeptidase n=1 Tax=Gilvimarinus sp. DZF01 TaxID=3461371 RepID=UPI0040454B3C